MRAVAAVVPAPLPGQAAAVSHHQWSGLLTLPRHFPATAQQHQAVAAAAVLLQLLLCSQQQSL